MTRSSGFDFAMAFGDIEKYICVALRDSRYHIDNFLPQDLKNDRIYVLVRDNGMTHGSFNGKCTIGLTIIGKPNDKHYTEIKGLMREIILKVKEDSNKSDSIVLSVDRVFGPIRIENKLNRPELLTSVEITLLGH